MSRLNVRSAAAMLLSMALVLSVGGGVAVAQEESPDGEQPTETPSQEPGETPGDGQAEEPGETPAANDSQNQSFIRVLHASPDAPAVDIYVQSQAEGMANDTGQTDGTSEEPPTEGGVQAGQISVSFTNVSFGNATNYVALPPGNYMVNVTLADDQEAVVSSANVSVGAGATTLATTGEITGTNETGFELVAYANNATQPAENESAVSVVHLSPDAPMVDVTTTNGTVLADNVTFRNATNYTNVSAGNYTVQVREATADNNGSVVVETEVSVEGGSAYSALALGYAQSAGSQQALQVTLIEDAVTVSENGTRTVQLPDSAEDGAAEPTPTPGAEPTPTEGGTAEPTPTESGEVGPTPTEATATEGGA